MKIQCISKFTGNQCDLIQLSPKAILTLCFNTLTVKFLLSHVGDITDAVSVYFPGLNRDDIAYIWHLIGSGERDP